MVALRKIEDKFAELFKGLPNLSPSSKESLANFWPWLALIAGLLQLLSAKWLYDVTRWTNSLTDLANTLSIYYANTPVGPTSFDKSVIYLGIIMLVVDAVILLMAFPHLKRRARKGWDLLFLGSLINLAYSVLQLFRYHGGFGSFLFSLIGSAIGFYLLFQVREKFAVK